MPGCQIKGLVLDMQDGAGVAVTLLVQGCL